MKFIFILFALYSSFAFADFPKNNLQIPINSKFSNSITEAEFNTIIDRAFTTYAPIVKSKKATLIINKLWTNNAVNAAASRFGGNSWFVYMYGGMARHPLVTNDAFLFVVCHEIGHHLGGAPKIGGIKGFWSSVEGQADYFAATKCMRKILINDDNSTIVKNMEIDPLLSEKCSSTYTNENEVALCNRIGMAGKSLGNLLASLQDPNATVKFDSPDLTIVKKTMKAHPPAQCRLDTYFSAVLCTKSFDEEIGAKDPAVGVCTKSEGYDFGSRPTCWYKPSKKEL